MGPKSGGVLPLPRAEFRVLSHLRSNLLLEGPESAIDATLAALKPHLSQPLWTWCTGLAIRLPGEPNGTLIVREVSRLDHDQQQQLVDWLDLAAGRVQVISTTS